MVSNLVSHCNVWTKHNGNYAKLLCSDIVLWSEIADLVVALRKASFMLFQNV